MEKILRGLQRLSAAGLSLILALLLAACGNYAVSSSSLSENSQQANNSRSTEQVSASKSSQPCSQKPDTARYPEQAQQPPARGAAENEISELKNCGWLCPTAFTLTDGRWSITAGENKTWCAEFCESDGDSPYQGEFSLNQTGGSGGSADLKGLWALDDERIYISMSDSAAEEKLAPKNGYPILINPAGEELRIFPCENGALPFTKECGGKLVLTLAQV